MYKAKVSIIVAALTLLGVSVSSAKPNCSESVPVVTDNDGTMVLIERGTWVHFHTRTLHVDKVWRFNHRGKGYWSPFNLDVRLKCV
jgi:hypothetical protein